MKIAIISPTKKAEKVIRQLVFPWKVNFSTIDEADVLIKYKTLEDTGKPTIIIPSETVEFNGWIKERNLTTVEMLGKKLKVPATDTLMLTLSPQTQHGYIKSSYSKITDDTTHMTRIDDSFLLPVDLIEEYGLKLRQTLNAKISSIYRFLTGLPIPYTLAPNRLRNLLLSSGKITNNDSYLDHLDLDALRYLLIKAIQEATGNLLQKKSWKGRRSVCLLTHDVDTRRGLHNALALKRIEERYDIPSTWFIPTRRYKLEQKIILQLANNGEVGVHGTHHDGKLIRLSKEEIINRLSEAKRILETTVGQNVWGFRAPLLQHNEKIIQGLEKADYTYDTSIPTWEPRHPSTMGSHGIGTIYPLTIYSTIEIPVTIPQDHQMTQILGLNVKQTIRNWCKIADNIKELGGICTFLIHPDYDLAMKDNLNHYEELLNFLDMDDNMWKTNPIELIANS